MIECLIPILLAGALVAGWLSQRGATYTPMELAATEEDGNLGCLLLTILVAAAMTMLLIGGAGAGLAIR